MKKSKLINLLSSFTKEDYRSFTDFVASPFFNKKQEVIAFYDYLKKRAPEFSDHFIERQFVYKSLYPDQTYDEKHIGYLMSYLAKLVEQFMGIRKYQHDNRLTNYHLLSALVERNLSKYYMQEHKKLATKLHQKNEKSIHSLLNHYLIADIANDYHIAQRKRKHDGSIQNVSDALDLFYITTQLQYSCAMVNRNTILSEKNELHLLDELQSAIKKPHLKKDPLIAIYSQILHILTKGVTNENFTFLRSLIQGIQEGISIEELKKIYQYAINFCAQMIRKGNKEYFEKCLDIYVEGITKEILFEKGFLSPWAFTNVVKLALNLKRYEWIEEFIHEYSPKLDDSFRENALHYNLADLYYNIKNFDKAIYNLNQVKFSDMIMHLGSREMLARIYYETQEEEALLSLIASFSIFLKRNKNISTNIKKSYLHFCQFLHQLMRKNPKKIVQIKANIETTPLLSSRRWLLKVADDIIKELKIEA